MLNDESKDLHIGKPDWLKSKIPSGELFFRIRNDLQGKNLFTVCQEAKCPNITECWSQNTATFMLLGDTCTRGCRFCNVKTGNPGGYINHEEIDQVAETVRVMKLKYVVITMVDRDDLSDGGAAHVAAVLSKTRETMPGIRIELLAGDFRGEEASLLALLPAHPEVFAHNLETVERLTPRVRDRRADYRQSLAVLRAAKKLASYKVFTKSSIMLGLGETPEELEQTLRDLREADVDFVTLGQYMRPSKKHLSIKRYVHPKEFDEFGSLAQSLGFRSVVSGPLVRSSYRAREFYELATGVRL